MAPLRRMLVPCLLLTACTSTERLPPQPRSEPAGRAPSPDLPADLRITLERTGCYGRCPMYEVTIDARGHVEWRGEQYVEYVGSEHAELPSLDPLVALYRRLAAVDFTALPSSRKQVREPTMCPSYSTDAPAVLVRLQADGADHRVYDYRGCREYPPMVAFRELEEQIDAVAGTATWIGPD